jgi:membrane protease YdiL (CAAX protease family)
MNTEDIHPAIPYFYGALIVGGLICLVRDLFFEPKESSIRKEVVLDPWKIKGLDLALILTFIYLLIFAAGALTIEGYKVIFNTEEIAEEHLFIFGFPMHIAILVSLYGFFRYFNLANDVPLNPVNHGILALVSRAFYYFLAIIPILMAVGYIWPKILEFFNLPLDHQDLVTQIMDMGLSPMFFLIAFLAVIMAPISEELLFRAFIYRSLKTYTSKNTSAVVTSLMFAGMHFNFHSFLPLFLLGLWLCRSYEKTGNLWVPIILHAFFNGNTLVTLMLLGS